MGHPTGERLHCDSCGAEIQFIKACPCPEREPKQHVDMCCGKEMRSLGVTRGDEVEEVSKPATA